MIKQKTADWDFLNVNVLLCCVIVMVTQQHLLSVSLHTY